MVLYVLDDRHVRFEGFSVSLDWQGRGFEPFLVMLRPVLCAGMWVVSDLESVDASFVRRHVGFK